MKPVPSFVALLLLAAPIIALPVVAFAQSQQMTQPSITQNQSQVQTNQNQQPPNARAIYPTVPTATENSVTKPQGPTMGPRAQSPDGKSHPNASGQ